MPSSDDPHVGSPSEGSGRVRLGPVPETMLITLWARAVETERKAGAIRDEKAREIVDALDYDFEAKLGRARGSAFAPCLRTLLIDRWVAEFLRSHPNGSVAELGTGLNTRFHRVDDGQVRWLDVDVSEAIALRRRFFEESDRYTMIEGAFGDDDWLEHFLTLPAPRLLVLEGVLLYLEPELVRRGLQQIREAAPGTEIIFDAGTGLMRWVKRLHPLMRRFEAPFRWLARPESVVGPGDALIRVQSLVALPPEERYKMPRLYRFAVRLLELLVPWLARTYVVSQLRLGSRA